MIYAQGNTTGGNGQLTMTAISSHAAIGWNLKKCE
jgi:hypothetical protein